MLALCEGPNTCFDALLEFARDVDAPRREMAFLRPPPTVRLLGGAADLRVQSPALSANVCLFDAGSGTGGVSDLFGLSYDGTASLQPEGLCLLEGGGIALREFMLESCNSPSGRPCDIPSLGN